MGTHEHLQVGSGFNGFKEGFGEGIHVNITLDLLGGFLINKVTRVISMAFYIIEDKRDGVDCLYPIHFHFQVNIPFRHGRVGSFVKWVVADGFVVVTIYFCYGIVDVKIGGYVCEELGHRYDATTFSTIAGHVINIRPHWCFTQDIVPRVGGLKDIGVCTEVVLD